MAAFLVDTNVLAYAYDPRDADRQARATAKLNGVLTILTEDQPSSSLIEGIRCSNPLDQGFDLARLD